MKLKNSYLFPWSVFHLAPPIAERWCARSSPCPLTLSAYFIKVPIFVLLSLTNKKRIVWE